MKYFVELRNRSGAYHVEIEDARDVYLLMEQCGELDDPQEAYYEGREVTTEKSSATKIWGEEIDDRQLMLRTLKGEFHRKTAMSVKIPKPKKEKKEE